MTASLSLSKTQTTMLHEVFMHAPSFHNGFSIAHFTAASVATNERNNSNMESVKAQVTQQIENAQSVEDCEAIIEQELESLIKCNKAKKDILEKQKREGFNFKGSGDATKCSDNCDNVVDPTNPKVCVTCKGCEKIFCKDCY